MCYIDVENIFIYVYVWQQQIFGYVSNDNNWEWLKYYFSENYV